MPVILAFPVTFDTQQNPKMTSFIDDDYKRSIIEHMNSDHADALVLYIKAYSSNFVGDIENSPIKVTMTDIDESGVTLEVKSEKTATESGRSVNIQFADAVKLQRLTRAEDVRSVLVLMTKQARTLLESP